MSVDVRRDPPDYFEYEDHGRRWPFILLAVAITLLAAPANATLQSQKKGAGKPTAQLFCIRFDQDTGSH